MLICHLLDDYQIRTMLASQVKYLVLVEYLVLVMKPTLFNF